MSVQIALDTINLEPTERLAHTEYSVTYPSLLQHYTGKSEITRESCRELYDKIDVDFIWGIQDWHEPWSKRGRTTDMGHAIYAEGGVDKREMGACPFRDIEEVLEFNAVKEYGLPPFDELVAYYDKNYRDRQAFSVNQLETGGRYSTIVSGAIEAFGWEMLLLGASELERFARVLETFAEYTMYDVRAQARTSMQVFIQHDDMVWTEGPFLPPSFYREAIFPHYKRFWDVLHSHGKKVLFCSDGRFDMFMDDLVECGADGFIFEPCNDFDMIVEKYGRTHCLIGSKVDCRTLAFGTWEQVKAEVDATLKLAQQCAGLIWAVGNHMPSNIPVSMAVRYFDYLRANGRR